MVELTSHAATQGRIHVRFVDSADSLTDDLKREVWNGLSIIEEEIVSAIKAPGAVITVEDVSFNEADFQPEGLAVAIIRWAEQELSLPKCEIKESFDRAANRYSFTFS
jgi:hypothetical protein